MMFMIFIFSIIVGVQCSVNFLLYGKETQSHTHTFFFFTLSSVKLHHKWLDIVPSAIQQDLIAYPFQRQWSASINPHFPVHPTPLSSLGNHKSIPQVHYFLFCGKVHLCHVSDSRYVISCGICLSRLDLLHSVWESLVPSMLLQMALFCSFLWLNSIPLCICTTSSSSIHLLLDIQVVSMSWLLWIVLQWTYGCMYLFQRKFCLDICPGVVLLGHIVVLSLVFWVTSMFFSIRVVSVYSPTNSVGGFPFLYTLSSICYLLTY